MFILIAPTIVSFLMMSCGHKHTVTEKYRINHLGVPSIVEVVQRTVEYSVFEPIHEVEVHFIENSRQQSPVSRMISSRMARLMCRISGADIGSSDSDERQDKMYQCSLKAEEINARLALVKQRFSGMELVERKEDGGWGIY